VARMMRATCATCPGTMIRCRLAVWAARGRARPYNRATRAAAVCGAATGSRSFPFDRRCTATTVRRFAGQGNGFVGWLCDATPHPLTR
jgi:hypothetical protein